MELCLLNITLTPLIWEAGRVLAQADTLHALAYNLDYTELAVQSYQIQNLLPTSLAILLW